MKTLRDRPQMAEISRIADENPLTKTLYLSSNRTLEDISPGQFIMVWLPHLDEIPLGYGPE